jgi:hypothetical protein
MSSTGWPPATSPSPDHAESRSCALTTLGTNLTNLARAAPNHVAVRLDEAAIAGLHAGAPTPILTSGQVEAGQVCQGTRTDRISATHAGFAPPSISMVTLVVQVTPIEPASSEMSSMAARTREPTGTGAGKRTLFEP